MAPDFTVDELHTICNWAMDAAEKARKHQSYWPTPYEKAQAIFSKAHEEYMKRKGEG